MSVTTTRRKIDSDSKHIVAILGASKAPKMGNYGAKLNILMPDNHTLLQHQINFIEHYIPNSEIYVSVGYDADRVIAKRPNKAHIIENTSWENTGESEELRLIINCANPNKLTILTGDIYSKFQFNLNFMESWVTSLTTEDSSQIGLKSENGYLDSFSFLYQSKFLGIINLIGEELFYFKKVLSRDKAKFAIWELFEDYVKSGYKIKNIEYNTKKIVKIISSKDLGIIRNTYGFL